MPATVPASVVLTFLSCRPRSRHRLFRKKTDPVTEHGVTAKKAEMTAYYFLAVQIDALRNVG